MNDIITSAREKYVVPERKLGQQIVCPSSLSQSFPPNCPVGEENLSSHWALSQANQQNEKNVRHSIGSCSGDGVLRKRSNENKNAKPPPNKIEDDMYGRKR